ncbi:MAG: hypothetical protein KIS78_13360 [Labilithrix sp.]|nr:hypothetical protein [Labilithrix sp.]MCW5833384.1 hypothetical protein [Labilithrix sp.]
MRFASLPLIVGITLTARAAAAQPLEPNLCMPDRPLTPGCQYAPPGRPPVVTPQEQAAYRARVEADYFAKNGPSAYDAALRQKDEERHRAWVSRAEAARPADIPVRFPLVEPSAGFRIGTVQRKSYGHAGPEVGLTFRFNRYFAVDVPIALMQTWAGSLGRWATFAASPAFVASLASKSSIVYARGGPDVLVPSGASGFAPNTMIGGHLGFGLVGFAASLPNYGYVGLGYELRASLRGGVGGPSSLLDVPRLGADGVFFLRIGL